MRNSEPMSKRKQDARDMTDEEIDRFMQLFRKYRDEGKLPANERIEFKRLSAMVMKQKLEDNH